MRAAHIVEFQTPKGYMLNGVWFGIHRPNTVYIWIHGLGSSVFSKMDIMQRLTKNKAAVLAFNNRGHDKLSMVSYQSGKKTKRKLAGGGAEIFTECVDDIDGAIRYAEASGAKHIYLVGHSTGCQKSVYWASKKGTGVRGIVLLAPISDYAGMVKMIGKAKLEKVVAYARSLVKKGKPHEFIPLSMWSYEPDTAQRFISLYTPDSVEEIFTYSQRNVIPKTLKKVRLPILALLAENDQFGDRPAEHIAEWFRAQKPDADVRVVAHADHGFKGAERAIASHILRFSKELSK